MFVQEADNGDYIPWIRLEALYCSDFILKELAEVLDAQITAVKVSSAESFKQLKETSGKLQSMQRHIVVDEGTRFSDLNNNLNDLRFDNVSKVWQEGEYSILGDVVSVWPIGFENPVRLEFFGEELEQIMLIDAESRHALEEIESVRLFAHGAAKDKVLEDLDLMRTGLDKPKILSVPVVFSDTSPLSGDFDFETKLFKADFDKSQWEKDKVAKRLETGWQVYFVINHKLDEARSIKEDLRGIRIFEEDLPRGFESKALKLVVLTDQELWGTVKLGEKKRGGRYAQMLLDEISPGDFVVHEDHGVGIYTGLKQVEGNSRYDNYLELKYAEKDRLLVPLHQVQKITKYVGVGNTKPKLTRLKGGHWVRVKNRVKKSVEKLAGELLRLYAMRSMAQADQLKFDNNKVKEFEKTFEFVETEDQLRAINEVFADLDSDSPMDRILVGDVGFGKTEVAMRAAFKMYTAGKQTAVLAPTTVLVEQHYHVFRQRMKEFGVEVAALSRFLDADEAKKVVSQLKKGEIDIIIGTHRLLSNDIEFDDLGLLVIDEEQKFGVAQKEKLKKRRVDTHVLSMSATPIPRTLNMALSGVKDISVIATPPIGRKSIKNFVKKFEWKEVVKAIKSEMERDGQVYFVHNRISSLSHIKQKLENLIPDIRVAVGHGQMSGEKLSRVMRDFNSGVYDVLLCTTIIENGLDLPNVNTLIVDRAEMLGLGQLYQLRGRIGRGKRQAFAYFFYYGVGGGPIVKKEILERSKQSGEKMPDKFKPLWSDARKRLDAIRDLEDLGSGFGLAERDLQIRGAGNFLGRQQHGNVSSVGFSLYCRLLAEKVEELKGK